VLAAAFCLMLALQSRSFAEYPDRAIRLLVPFPAGGAVDIVARVVAAKLADDLGKPVVVENKAGAGGIIATDATAKAAPDGYTLLLTTPNHTINAALQPTLPYDTEKDIAPVSIVAEVPEVLVSHPGAPFKTFPEFIAFAKQNPGKLNYASAGIGTLPHITMELLLNRTGVKVAHIPYRGAAPAMNDLLSGQVQLNLRHLKSPGRRGQAAHARDREPHALQADARYPDHRRDGSAWLRRHSVDWHGRSRRHPQGRDRQTRGGLREGGAGAGRDPALREHRRRSGRWRHRGLRRPDRSRVTPVARPRESRQYQAAIKLAKSASSCRRGRCPACRS
jgi:hypothetical protein